MHLLSGKLPDPAGFHRLSVRGSGNYQQFHLPPDLGHSGRQLDHSDPRGFPDRRPGGLDSHFRKFRPQGPGSGQAKLNCSQFRIILFSIPLLIGNLFQQLYNAVDSYVVGNYVGKVALAAVGASTPIINMLIGFFMGISTGAGVVIAQFFGAGNTCKMKRAIHNSIALTLVMGVVV